MDDIDKSSNKTFGTAGGNVENKYGYPIHKCHFLEGKYFVVIDGSIVEQLNFSSSRNTELYFEQEITKEDCIVLHPLNIGEVGRQRDKQRSKSVEGAGG